MRAWILAARPKRSPRQPFPYCWDARWRWRKADSGDSALLCLLFALLMQIDANLINDLFDYRKGSDRKDRLGPERACAQGWISPRAMKRGIALITATACATGLCLLFYGGTELIVVGAVCVVFAFLYTAGPYPLAYHGWGDGLVIVFFGFVPVGVTYLYCCHGWTTGVTANLAGLRTGERYAADGKQLPGSRAGCAERQTDVGRAFRPESGQPGVPDAGNSRPGFCLTLLSGGYFAAGYSRWPTTPFHLAAWRRMAMNPAKAGN